MKHTYKSFNQEIVKKPSRFGNQTESSVIVQEVNNLVVEFEAYKDSKNYIAKLTGLDSKFGFKREFLNNSSNKNVEINLSENTVFEYQTVETKDREYYFFNKLDRTFNQIAVEEVKNYLN